MNEEIEKCMKVYRRADRDRKSFLSDLEVPDEIRKVVRDLILVCSFLKHCCLFHVDCQRNNIQFDKLVNKIVLNI